MLSRTVPSASAVRRQHASTSPGSAVLGAAVGRLRHRSILLPAASLKDNGVTCTKQSQIEPSTGPQPSPSAPKPSRNSSRPVWVLPSVLAASAAGFMDTGFSISGPASTLQSMGVLALIVAVHEAGHFIAARAQGICVSKFSIGFGPSVFSTKGADGIEYSFNMFPLGGYVAFPGDELARPPKDKDAAASEGASTTEAADSTKAADSASAATSSEPAEPEYDPNDPDLLKNRPIAQRAIVISAGVAANIVFALATLLVQVSTVGKAESEFLPGTVVAIVNEPSAAARAGFHNGDIIRRVAGYQVPASAQQVSDVVNVIKRNPEKQIVFELEREGKIIELPCAPDLADNGDGRIGVQLSSNVKISHTIAQSFPEAIDLASSEFNRLATSVYNGLSALFTNFSKAASQMTGPVAIVAAGSDILQKDNAGIFQFCAIININLAAVNILPLPALDGGYLALLSLEALRGGKKISQEVEGLVMSSGLMLLLGAGIFLVIRDTLNLILK